jgi:hypothetical protein
MVSIETADMQGMIDAMTWGNGVTLVPRHALV